MKFKRLIATTLTCTMLMGMSVTASAFGFSIDANGNLITDGNFSDTEFKDNAPAKFTHEEVLVTELDKDISSYSRFSEGVVSVSRNLGEWGKWSTYKSGQLIFSSIEEYEEMVGKKPDMSTITEIEHEGYISDDFRYGFLDIYGNELFPFTSDKKYENFSDGLAIVSGTDETLIGDWSDENLKGYIDKTGNIVIPMKYIRASEFNDGFAYVVTQDSQGVYHDEIIDKTGKTVLAGYDISDDFSSNPYIIEKDGKSGLANNKGQIILEPTYDWIGTEMSFTEEFLCGLRPIGLNGKSGYVNTDGDVVFDIIYTVDTRIFSDDKIWVEKDGLYAVVNSKGEELTPYQYEPTPYTGHMIGGKNSINHVNLSGTALVKKGDSYVYLNDEAEEVYFSGSANEDLQIDKNGKIIPAKSYGGIVRHPASFVEGLDTVYEVYTVDEEQKFGFIDTNLQLVIPEVYMNTKAVKFSRGTTYDFYEGYGIFEKDGIVCIIRNPLSSTSAPVKPNVPTSNATPTASKVLVNGTSTAFDAYKIGDSNYFKLRDIANVVSGTDKNFEVDWDGDKNAINLLSDKAYTVVGGEMATGDGSAKNADLSTSSIYVDGEKVSLMAYTINGNNYFKLRDVCKVFDIGVTWDNATSTIGIDTSIGYTE